ncbi:MAG: UbiD family decarboxylase [Euryarchaeota archaeon]|nr:UbiD family decarboxylase [Euryarchaeota archaeon]MDE1836339.1 UbiD family decarboxylase [Euryarchaeota archaeon]MDE1879137.1 UbiD family decarboxylase [Euryarchaeota archaeon]MDE2044265.1 UbiD family decarboxylase [Thermoplasmata archaeon]
MPLKDFLRADREVRVFEGPIELKLGVTRELLRGSQGPVWFQGTGKGSLVGNLWATRERVAHYFGIAPSGLPDLLLEALEHPIAPELVPRSQATWAAHEAPADLTKFPVPWFYPEDAGSYLSAAVFSARWQGKRNLSYHRVWVQGPSGGPVRLVPRHLDRMVREARKEGIELPVATVLGAPLEFLLAGAVSTDYAVDEMEIASALCRKRTGRPLRVVELESGARVPAEAEIVLEGKFLKKDVPEGPFLDILGTYDAVRDQPVVEFHRMYHVEDPVLPVIVAGSREHFILMGLPREPMILRAVRAVVPGTKAVRLTEGGAAWLHGVVSIDKRRDGDGRNAILAALSGHASMKRVVVVDQDINIFDDQEVEWAIATRFQADRGLLTIPHAVGSSLDPSASTDGLTCKWGLDATLPVKLDRRPFTKGRLP